LKLTDYFALSVFFIVLGTFVYLIVYSFFGIIIRPIVNFIQLSKPLHPLFVKILEEKFPYYNSLNRKEKKEFAYRLNYFLRSKDFYGRQNLEITDEMKIMVGASAVQITFGFEPLQLASFDKIILYPKAYYSKYTKGKNKGEVNSAGIIVFSWEDFLKGYQISTDGYNVGLHEMAHAIKIEDFTPTSECAFLDETILMHWQNLTNVEMRKIRNGENNFLRSYAGTNREEFFAVCVEQFFEQAEEFQKYHPELYFTLAELLNQDPLDRKRHYDKGA
jgi:Mlc titration factor MtfA (ptsG expression regulator)